MWWLFAAGIIPDCSSGGARFLDVKGMSVSLGSLCLAFIFTAL
jgi:hypothetical protein